MGNLLFSLSAEMGCSQLIFLNPDNSIGYFYYRGNAYRKSKNYRAVIADYTKAIKINPNGGGYLNRGIAYSELRDYETAASDINKAAQLYQRQGDTKNYKQMQQMLKLLKLEEILTN
jgi:tetratricopeptide (TPR) repeat protein